MPNDKRRADGRRRAWGRGPIILRFEPLEARELLSTATPAVTARPDLVGQSFQTPTDLNWGGSFQAQGVVVNQGNAPTTKAFQVDIYASTTPVVGPDAVLLGEATIASGLKAGSQSAYSVPLTLPATPLSGLNPSGSFYVAAVIDPQHAIDESNTQNNADTGAGFDYELISPPTALSASLNGSRLSVSPSETGWGGSFSMTQQVSNNGEADAPATRALVVLTPSGSTPGGASDVTIGSVSIPAIPAGQSVTVNPSITLPTRPPSSLVGVTRFAVSVVQDADYVTNAMYPHAATQGVGLDQAGITITTPSYVNTKTGPQPGLAVTAVAVDSAGIKWGQSFQVATTLQNSGSVDPGPFRVRYLLVGTDGTLGNSLFLADSTVSNLAAGATQNIETTLHLPTTLPGGATVNSLGEARIAVVVDPENSIDEPRTGTSGVSGIIQLQVVGTDGQTTAVKAQATTLSATAAKAITTTQAKAAPTKTATKSVTVTKHATAPKPVASPRRKTVAKPTIHSFEHNLKVFPNSVYKYYKKTFKI